jgi:hypothetical protein
MRKKQTKKKVEVNDSINYKKLFFELMIVLTILFGCVLVILYPAFRDHGVFDDHTYEEFNDILDEVDNYDYSKGRDLELEKRLDEGWHDDFNANKKYFYGIASATYYCYVGYYNTSQNIFYELYETIPDNGEKPRQVLELHDVFCDRFLEEKKENK